MKLKMVWWHSSRRPTRAGSGYALSPTRTQVGHQVQQASERNFTRPVRRARRLAAPPGAQNASIPQERGALGQGAWRCRRARAEIELRYDDPAHEPIRPPIEAHLAFVSWLRITRAARAAARGGASHFRPPAPNCVSGPAARSHSRARSARIRPATSSLRLFASRFMVASRQAERFSNSPDKPMRLRRVESGSVRRADPSR
jgi:hypothetical protein